jgi:heme oxygenase
VLEGATLGGQIITRHLQTHLGLTPESGTAFFHGYGPETGPRWKSFVSGLRTEAQKVNADDGIIENANLTFETIAQWLFPKAKAH